MNWIEALHNTYENCTHAIGDMGDKTPLVPVGHIPQTTQVELQLDQNGVLLSVVVDPMTTIIPCTEKSAGRTAAPEPHPLSDKLKYVASDYFSKTGEKQKNLENTHHALYMELLKKWVDSAYSDAKIEAVLRYLKNNQGKVLEDLCRRGVYPTDEEGLILKKWEGEKDATPLNLCVHKK